MGGEWPHFHVLPMPDVDIQKAAAEGRVSAPTEVATATGLSAGPIWMAEEVLANCPLQANRRLCVARRAYKPRMNGPPGTQACHGDACGGVPKW